MLISHNQVNCGNSTFLIYLIEHSTQHSLAFKGFREFGQKCIKLLPEPLTRSEAVYDACGDDQLLDVNEGDQHSFLIEINRAQLPHEAIMPKDC